MAASESRFIIAREAWLFVLPVALFVAFLHYLIGTPWGWVLWVPVLLMLYVFREPKRPVPPQPLAVVCPVDGNVLDSRPVHDIFLDRDAIRISIKMNTLGSYSVRSPIEGKVMQQWFPRGEGLKTMQGGKALDCGDVRYAQWTQTDEGDDVVVCVSEGVPGVRLHCYAQSGERLGQGHRCGYISFGARIDVLVPSAARVAMQRGQRVRAGSDVIATLIHK